MQLLRVFVVTFIGVAFGLAADLPSPAPSVDSKLRKLEIRRIERSERLADDRMHGPRDSPRQRYCRDTPRAAYCRLDHLVNWLAYAFQVNAYLIQGPEWITDDDLYMIRFEYDVEGRCPTILRALLREILVEKFSLTVERERHESEMLVVRAPPGQPLAAVSRQSSCSLEVPPWSDSSSGNAAIFYRGCTVSELGSRLASRFRSSVDVVDETGATSRHDFSLHASSALQSMDAGGQRYLPERVARELHEQLGVDARLEDRPTTFLVVDGPKPPKRIDYEAKGVVSPAPCPGRI